MGDKVHGLCPRSTGRIAELFAFVVSPVAVNVPPGDPERGTRAPRAGSVDDRRLAGRYADDCRSARFQRMVTLHSCMIFFHDERAFLQHVPCRGQHPDIGFYVAFFNT